MVILDQRIGDHDRGVVPHSNSPASPREFHRLHAISDELAHADGNNSRDPGVGGRRLQCGIAPPRWEPVFPATTGFATLSMNCEFVIVSTCPGYWALKARPPPPFALAVANGDVSEDEALRCLDRATGAVRDIAAPRF